MVNLTQWTIKHGITIEALAELQALMGATGVPAPLAAVDSPNSEAGVQALVRLNAGKAGVTLWRNNVGAGYMQDGSFVRWGLANDSQAMNEKIKSSDLIGIRPLLITGEMVGATVGQFVAREIKAAGWAYGGTDREEAQLAFIQFILSRGGDARFANRGDQI